MALAAPMLLAACGNGPPSSVTFDLRADDGLNPTSNQLPAPAAVRLYLLSSPNRLRNADYFALMDHERETLDSDVLAKSDLFVMPGQRETVKMDVPKGATHAGVLVSYRDLDKSTWLAVKKLGGERSIPVQLDPLAVRLIKRFPDERRE